MTDITPYDSLPRPDLPTHPTKSYNLRHFDQIVNIIPHHTGDWHDDIVRHANYHIRPDKHRNKTAWPGIAYHLYGSASGIMVGNEIDRITYHARGRNTDSIGVVVPGNYNERPPTDEEYWRWMHMILICERYLGRRLKVRLHCQVSATTCPGRHFDLDYFMSELNPMRQIV